MIVYKKGSLLDVSQGIIVHGCNMQGVMASGVAKSLRAMYPEIYEDYILLLHKKPRLGDYVATSVNSKLLVISALTQQFYGRDPDTRYVSYSAITHLFLSLREAYPNRTLNIPKIGAGLGNGDWDEIESRITSVHPQVICWEL